MAKSCKLVIGSPKYESIGCDRIKQTTHATDKQCTRSKKFESRPIGIARLIGKWRINIYGNLIINRNFNPGSGTIVFSGNKNRSIKGNNLVFYNLALNLDNHAMVDLLSDIQINNNIKFEKGKIRTNKFIVHFMENGSAVGPNTSGYILGNVRKNNPY